MNSFLALSLLVVSCTAQLPTRTMYNNLNNYNMDLLKYQGPLARQYYGQSMMEGQTDRLLNPTTMMEMKKMNQFNRILRALQLSNPEQVQQQQLPTRFQYPQETSGLMKLDQLLRTELLKQYLLGQITNQDMMMMMNQMRPTTTTTMYNNNYNNDYMNLRRLMWTYPRLMSVLIRQPTIQREMLNNLLNNQIQTNQMTSMYGNDQSLVQNLNGMYMPQMNRIDQTATNFNGMPNRMGMLMMMMNRQNQVPTYEQDVPMPMNKIVRTTLIMTKPMIKELMTDKKVQEKIIDPVMGREQITTGDFKIVDKNIIPTNPEMITPESTVIDPMNNEDMMTLEDNKAKVSRDVMMKKISLIKKMMNANKRFMKFNQEREQVVPVMDQFENEKPNEMMTGAEEKLINKIVNVDDAFRSRRQSRLTPVQSQEQLFTLGNIQLPSTSFNTQQMMLNQELNDNNRPIYTFNNIEGQQRPLMVNNQFRYNMDKLEKPTMTHIPLTSGNSHIGNGFSVTNPGARYTLPTMNNMNMNNMNMNMNTNQEFIGV